MTHTRTTFTPGQRVMFRESGTGPAEPGTIAGIEDDHPNSYRVELDDGGLVAAFWTELSTDTGWYRLPSAVPGSPIDTDAGSVGGDFQAGPAFAVSWRRHVAFTSGSGSFPGYETLTLYHFACLDDPEIRTYPKPGPYVATMIELIQHTTGDDPGGTELEADYRYSSDVLADPTGEMDPEAALDKANRMARQFTIDNLGIDPQTLWRRCPAGYEVARAYRNAETTQEVQQP